MRAIGCIALALLLHASAASAQVRVLRAGDERLAGIGAVDILVTVSPPMAACPLDLGALRDAAIRRLRTAGLSASVSEKARSSFHSVVIDITIQREHGLCAAAIGTDLVTEVRGIPEAERVAEPAAWGSLLLGYMPLLRGRAVVLGTAMEIGAAVRSAAEMHVASIAAAIRARNK
jgi:hypothetical protein